MHLPILLVLTLGLVGGPLTSQSAAQDRGRATLDQLEKQITQPKADHAKLRRDLVTFRLAHPGTPATSRAASLLGRLPSALDRLDPKAIPALEQFAWHPRELVAILGEHRGRQGASVTSVAFFPDGKRIVSGGSLYVRMWDAATMRLEAILPHPGRTTSVAVSKDGKLVASGTEEGMVYVSTIPARGAVELKQSLRATTGVVFAVAFHPDNKRLAVACEDNLFRLYDITDPKGKDIGQFTDHTRAVRCLAFSPDGKFLATGSDDQSVRLWEVGKADIKARSRIEGHGSELRCLAFNSKGTLLASGCQDGTLRLWRIPAGTRVKQPLAVYPGSKSPIYSVSFAPAGNSLAIADDNLRLLNILPGAIREAFLLTGHLERVRTVAHSPDGKLLVTGSDDWTVRTWYPRKNKAERFPPRGHLSAVHTIAFAPDDRSLASGSQDRVVRLWDLDRREPRLRTALHGDRFMISSVAYTPDGTVLAAAGHSKRVLQWDAGKGTPRASCAGAPEDVHRIVYSHNGRFLLARSGKAVVLFDAARGSILRRFATHETPVIDCAFSADDREVLTTSGNYLRDKRGRVVVEGNKPVFTDCFLRRFHTRTGEEIEKIAHPTPIYYLTVAPDGTRFWTGHNEHHIREWLRQEGKVVKGRVYQGNAGNADGQLLASADGRSLFSNRLDGKVIHWEVATGKRVREWTFHENPTGLALTLDGRHLAVSVATGVVYILRLEPPPDRGK